MLKAVYVCRHVIERVLYVETEDAEVLTQVRDQAGESIILRALRSFKITVSG